MTNGVKEVEKNTTRRFAAFISYAHCDAAIAAKLQSKLERYRLPKHIAEAHAGGTAALGQIFRDREDLAAAPSLSEAIRAAISEAEALVVICSPDAKASRWVGEEISLFRQLHPSKPILAAVVRGEPEEAFPDALTGNGTEPLAADLRAEADGEALGFLKIVAGIAGVPLDALVQRDAQRRIRRVTWITAGALAAMLIMGLMTTLAIQSRNEAARQRAEAEGLVEYMLTDLRDKLKGVGRLEVMEAVNGRAMTYYSNQGTLSALPADSIERRARILRAMGEDYEKQGDLAKASVKFDDAYRATAALIQKDPNNPLLVLAHAKSEYWVGYTKQKQGNFTGALRSYEKYLTLTKRALALGVEPSVGLREEGWAHNAMGVVQLQNLKNSGQARIHFQAYKDIFVRITRMKARDKEALHSLSDAHAWIADIELSEKNLSAAFIERNNQLKVLDQLLAVDPKNVELIWYRIGANRALFRICLRQENYPCAGAAIARARDMLASQNIDRSNRDWLWQSAYVALDTGFLAEKTGNLKAASSALAEAETFGSAYKKASQGDNDIVRELDTTIAVLAKRI